MIDEKGNYLPFNQRDRYLAIYGALEKPLEEAVHDNWEQTISVKGLVRFAKFRPLEGSESFLQWLTGLRSQAWIEGNRLAEIRDKDGKEEAKQILRERITIRLTEAQKRHTLWGRIHAFRPASAPLAWGGSWAGTHFALDQFYDPKKLSEIVPTDFENVVAQTPASSFSSQSLINNSVDFITAPLFWTFIIPILLRFFFEPFLRLRFVGMLDTLKSPEKTLKDISGENTDKKKILDSVINCFEKVWIKNKKIHTRTLPASQEGSSFDQNQLRRTIIDDLKKELDEIES